MIAFFLLAATPSAPPAATQTSASILVTGLRNSKGKIRVCLTRSPAHFPDCASDPAAVSQTVPASVPLIQIVNITPGQYAIAVFHDVNNNGKLDKSLGIPREGFGFSRNPKIRFGPPRFADVRIMIAPGMARQEIHLKYLL